jgi:Rieske Fe-S protein
MGFPATGREFAAKQIHWYRIVDGKIRDHWAVRDDLGQGLQLGFIQAPPSVPFAPPATRVTSPRIDPGDEHTPFGRPVTGTADVPVGGGVILGDAHVVITQPETGRFRAFTSTCTHMGCTVGEVSDGRIKCPRHGSQFSIADGSVVREPAARPLTAYELEVGAGQITIVGRDRVAVERGR